MSSGFFASLLILGQLWFSPTTKAHAESLQPAAESPNPWFWLSRYDRTLTRAEFEAGLPPFDPFHALKNYADIDDAGITFYPSQTERRAPQFHLAFAPNTASELPFPGGYRTPAAFRALRKPNSTAKPLDGLRIAIDPGHIGGAWGQIEDRSTYYAGIGRIQEGDMNTVTAKILEKQLTDLGASVFLTRHDMNPVTTVRPADLTDEALALLVAWRPDWAAIPPEKRKAALATHIAFTTHLLFERKYEFLARAEKVRENFSPDITLVLYINATPSSGWGHLIGVNQNIFFVEGAYEAEEIGADEQRERLVYKVLDRVTPVEYEVAASIARAFTRITGFKPVGYGDTKSTRLIDPNNFYVVARNLGAARQQDGPVVTAEPYFMNNRIVAQRLVAGDYEGERTFGGQTCKSFFREYADGVVEGLLASYGPQSGATLAKASKDL